METNAALKSLLFNARLICLVKFQTVEKSWGKGNSEVEMLHEKYKTLFAHCSNPQFWKKEISFTAGETTKLILKLDATDPTKQATYLTAANALLQHLQESLLKQPLADITSVSTSTWNLKMLSAIRQVLQQVDARKSFFKNKGTDLNKHATFPALEVYQNEIVATYRSLLISNAVEATETKVDNVKKRKSMMEAATDVDLFVRLFEKWTEYIDKQIKTDALIAHFVDTPSTKNKKALAAISSTLVKMDQQIATLANKGKDFSQQANFSTLHADQKKWMTAYHQALLANAIESKDSEINKIKKIGDEMASVKDLNTLEEKYTAINDLMRATSSTSA